MAAVLIIFCFDEWLFAVVRQTETGIMDKYGGWSKSGFTLQMGFWTSVELLLRQLEPSFLLLVTFA